MILVSLQLMYRVRYSSKNIIHAVRVAYYHGVCMDDETNTHTVYRFDTQQYTKFLEYFWVSLKMKITFYNRYKVPLREEARGVAQERNEKHPA